MLFSSVIFVCWSAKIFCSFSSFPNSKGLPGRNTVFLLNVQCVASVRWRTHSQCFIEFFKLISLKVDENWPARSPNFVLCDYFLWVISTPRFPHLTHIMIKFHSFNVWRLCDMNTDSIKKHFDCLWNIIVVYQMP